MCLLEAIEAFKPFPKATNKPIRACVYDYYNRIKDGVSNITGDCISVKVTQGVIALKDTLLMMPQDVEVGIKGIEV